MGLEFKDVKLWRERRFAKKYIQGCYIGCYIKQYSDLWNYSHSILERNPSSYCKENVNPESLPDKSVFDGLFISYLVRINEFKEACRPFIGLDGTFLKAEGGGVLLDATSRDANNQIFSLVVGVVAKENKNN